MLDLELYTKELKALIAKRTTADNPEALHDVVVHYADQLRAAGLNVEVFESNGVPSLLAYRAASRPKKFKVLLNGHLDVVPGKPEQFKATVKDGRMYGRGTIDMKAAALLFTKLFIELAPTLPYDLGLQLVTDEESAGQNGTGYQVKQGVRADFVLDGEFTQGDINYGAKGVCWATVKAKGETAHSAYLWNGENAVMKLTKQVQQLLQNYPVPAPETWATTANVASISTSNVTRNKVPDDATAKIDIRYMPDDPNFASRQSAQEYLGAVFEGSEIVVDEYEPSHDCAPDNPYLKQLAASREHATGKQPEPIRKHGASDVRFYSDVGVPGVNFGLTGNEIHGDNEYMELDSVQPFWDTVHHFLSNVR